MTKSKLRLLIPYIIVSAVLAYCWYNFIVGFYSPTWRHYIGLALFTVVSFFLFKRLKAARILMGVYFLLSTFNIIAITAIIRTDSISIGPVSTPPIQPLSLLLFIIYAILNTDLLIEEYLDYKEKNKGL